MIGPASEVRSHADLEYPMAPITLHNDTITLTIDHEHGCDILELGLLVDGELKQILRTGEDGIGSFLMLPWTNRIKDARFSFGGVEHQLNTNHPDGTSIHGIGRDYSWGIADRSPYSARCVFDSRSIEDANFPYDFGAVLRVEIGERSVEIELEVTNLDNHSMPCGAGHHPYFYRSLCEDPDELSLRAGVVGRYPCTMQIPNGPMSDESACERFRNGGPIGNPDLDDVFGGFDGRAVLEWTKSGVQCAIECSEAFGHLVVFTPRTEKVDASMSPAPPLPWVCVEPVTMVNDGFNEKAGIDSGVRVLGPGETLKTTMSLGFSRL